MRIRAQRRLPAIGLGVTLCAMAIMTIQSAVSAPHEPEVTVGPWELSHSVVFRIPSVPSSTWVWRMLVGTVDNWCHIEGSLSSPGGWEDHFGREVSFFTLGSADTPWDAFQPEFDGKIEPCGGPGPGPGPGEVVIHDWDVDGTGKFDYFIQPHNKVACVGTEVTFRSYIWDEEDGTKQSVSSDWEVYGYPQYNTTNTVSITFTPDEPDTYTVEGTAVSTGIEQSDTATLTVVGYEVGRLSRPVQYLDFLGEMFYHHDVLIRRYDGNIEAIRRGFFATNFAGAITAAIAWISNPLLFDGYVNGYVSDEGDWGEESMTVTCFTIQLCGRPNNLPPRT